MRLSIDGLQEEYRTANAPDTHNIALRESYGVGDGTDEAMYMVWSIELRRLADNDTFEEHVVLVPQFSREVH